MTSEEAIQQLGFDRDMILFDSLTGEEITPEMLKLINKENYLTYIADGIAIEALKEIQQYREIGTVEECREAREKEIPKIPKFMSMIGEYNAMFRCFCGYGFSYDCTDTEPFFCKKCGQALRMESEE